VAGAQRLHGQHGPLLWVKIRSDKMVSRLIYG
jgi:hypothetical protein